MSFLGTNKQLADQNKELQRQIVGLQEQVAALRQNQEGLDQALKNLEHWVTKDAQIDAAQKDLDRINLWITNAETRAYVVLTAQTVIVAAAAFVGVARYSALEKLFPDYSYLEKQHHTDALVSLLICLLSLIVGSFFACLTLYKALQATRDQPLLPLARRIPQRLSRYRIKLAAEDQNSVTRLNLKALDRLDRMVEKKHKNSVAFAMPFYEKVATKQFIELQTDTTQRTRDKIMSDIIDQMRNDALIAREKYKSLSLANLYVAVQVVCFAIFFLSAGSAINIITSYSHPPRELKPLMMTIVDVGTKGSAIADDVLVPSLKPKSGPRISTLTQRK